MVLAKTHRTSRLLSLTFLAAIILGIGAITGGACSAEKRPASEGSHP